MMLVLSPAPIASQAECVTVPIEKAPTGPVAKPTLVFSGTVTAVDLERFTVSIEVDRVWAGRLRKSTKLIVVGGIEGGATAHSFKPGTAYLVSYLGDIHRFAVVEPDFPAGTLGVLFGCGDGPVPLSEAAAELKRLGRGRAPLP